MSNGIHQDPGHPLRKQRHVILLAALSCLYLILYLQHPALPGTNPDHIQGWWGWFDQGEYLKAARAMAAGDPSPHYYFYPPLYPMLGVPFLAHLPSHPFLPVNLAALLIYAHCFVRLGERTVGWTPTVLVLLLGIGWPADVRAVWIEPWTTTFVAALQACLVWSLWRVLDSARSPSRRLLAALGAMGGMIAATRPLDAVVLVPLYLVLAGIVLLRRDPSHPLATASRLACLVIPGLAGVAFFGAFNLVVHGSLQGYYFGVAAKLNGVWFSDLPEKLVSTFLDSGALYSSAEDAILAHMPWLAVALPAAAWLLIWGTWFARVLVVTIALTFGLYLPYTDLLPTGIWRFHNIHYFKWTFPFLMLLTLMAARDVWRMHHDRARMRWAASICVAACLVLCVRIKTQDVRADLTVATEGGPRLLVSAPVDHAVVVDRILLPGLHGGIRDTLFGLQSKVRLNGRPLQWVRDYRFLPAHGTSGHAQLVFIRPVSLGQLEIEAPDLALEPGKPATQGLRTQSYAFGVGWPGWLPGSVKTQ